MVFCGIVETEQIDLHPETDLDQLYSICLTKAKHEPKFYVYCDYDSEWVWEFWNTSKTDYERVKMCILDIAGECDDIDETLDVITEAFFRYFDDMLVVDKECECACGGVGCNNHLN